MNGSKQKNRILRPPVIGVSIFFATVVYAALRYQYFKGVSLEQFPLYMLNKAVSWTSVIFIGWAFLTGILNSFHQPRFGLLLAQRKTVGLMGAGLALLHVLMSFPILTPAYYPKFFEPGGTGVLVAGIEGSLLVGALSLCLFLMVAAASLPGMKEALGHERWIKIQRWAYIAYVLALLHIAPIGYFNWMAPGDWPGGLPPISLLCCLWILVVIGLRLVCVYQVKMRRGRDSNPR